jgi:hypothetical protein
VPRWPAQSLRDVIAMAIVFAALLIYTTSTNGVDLAAPADPSERVRQYFREIALREYSWHQPFDARHENPFSIECLELGDGAIHRGGGHDGVNRNVLSIVHEVDHGWSADAREYGADLRQAVAWHIRHEVALTPRANDGIECCDEIRQCAPALWCYR